ncbi:GTPase ObgE [Patescibacteria group bacterium]|nr:GTPase ObgE [Patescibacteria group bacterium]MDE1946824.1 GTPase ObgE [Patescibacteria group bacterium]MDE2011190.1 GTPase ObgE [Patescibacteria group bacterium]
MSFIDEITFHASAGRGGNGVVRWRHEKAKEFAGAAGGNGGRGGSVFVRAVRDINILSRHKTTKNFRAGNGEDGMGLSKHGKNGEDFFIDLPIGSIAVNRETGRTVELLEEGQTILILHGGRGGLGNEHFKASTNVKPEQSTNGMPGEEADFTVELNLIADIGLVGLPNAGKSSLLNAMTGARAKVASYAFTTLDPNLGVLPGGFIVADIPGLIEGAAEGKGLGDKFLRHIKRTKMIMHLISLEESNNISNKTVDNSYRVIRRELEKFGNGLADKREIIVLTKTDLASPEEVAAAEATLLKYNKEISKVTILDDYSVKKLTEAVIKKVSVTGPTGATGPTGVCAGV